MREDRKGNPETAAPGAASEPEAGRTYSRRDFLRVAGIGGLGVGMAAGLGGILSACGEGEESTTTTVEAAAGATTTQAVAEEETGRELKIGFVEPLTGPLASFAIPTAYCRERWNEYIADGIVFGDSKKHPVTIITRDSQSDTNRASQVTADLITNDGVDLVMTASSGDTVNPVADQCEALEVPCVSTDAPWQSYFYGRGGDPAVGFKWTYHMFFGVEDQITTFLDIWSQVPHNKVVGGLWPNDADGNAIRPAWAPIFPQEGFKLVDAGPYQDGTEDFSSIISQFKEAGVEIITGAVIPSDWTNFWKQAAQQGLKDRIKVATIGKALLFPQTLEAIGDIGEGLSCEIWWTPAYPFKSSLTGETCQEFADEFERRTDQQWTQPLMHYVTFEVVVDALRRAATVDDKNVVLEAIKATKLDTLAGPIDFTAPVAEGTLHPVPNVVKTPMVGGQWFKGTKWPYDITMTTNAAAPIVPVQAKVQALPL